MMWKSFFEELISIVVGHYGIAGLVVLTLGFTIFLVLNLNIYPVLSQSRAYRVIITAMFLPFVLSLMVIILWSFNEISGRHQGKERGLEIQPHERKIDGVILRDGIAYDENGNKAGFISIVSQDYNWRLGSSTEIELIGGGSAALNSHLSARGIYSVLLDCDVIISIGMSSYEMIGDNIDIEIERGQMRAHIIQTSIKEIIPKFIEFYEINLGKNMFENKKNSYMQRMIVVLGIKKEVPYFNVESILNKNSLRNLKKLNVSLDQYSNFDVRPMR